MITLVDGKQHMVIKRDGRKEPYTEEKMRKVLKWACIEAGIDNEQLQDMYINNILDNAKMRIYDSIEITKLFNSFINITYNLVSTLYPEYTEIAKHLYIQKIFKDRWKMKRVEFPHYSEIIKIGKEHDIYGEAFYSITDSEIDELDKVIKANPIEPKMAGLLGLRVYDKKYCLEYEPGKKFELPSHVAMRVAINGFYNDPDDRLEYMKTMYNLISDKIVTVATPININAGTKKPMLASCVLTKMEDDTFSINMTCNNIGMFSREGGGTACNVSAIRSVGSTVDKTGKSSGKIPVIKMIESVIVEYNQKGTRPGACCVYYNWWDYEVTDLVMLKDEGGTEDKRARKLMYGICINKLFLEKVVNNEFINLFDPKDVPMLLKTHGEEFNKWYEIYSNDKSIRRKEISAVELMYDIAKVRNETGNLYIFLTDNVNDQSPYKVHIDQSNLCTEITLPTQGPILKENKLVDCKIHMEYEGMISLCNLSSITIPYYMELNEDDRYKAVYTLLRMHANQIDSAYYPVKDGEFGNKMYRPIGIGLSGLAEWFAKQGIKFSSNEAKDEMFRIMENVAYNIYKASNQLAKERGVFPYYNETKWGDGWLPIDARIDDFNKRATEDMKDRWEKLREDIKRYGVYFSSHIAIAPTATSALHASTEGIEPIKQLVMVKVGNYTEYQVAPNIRKYGANYELAYDIDNKHLIELASIRQIFIDQSQSVNTYDKTPNSAKKRLKEILLAHKLGLKTLYYLVMPTGEEVKCDSCT